MVEYSNKLYLYGGLGCEKLLTWACFDLASRKWSTLELDDTIANLQSKLSTMQTNHDFLDTHTPLSSTRTKRTSMADSW
jgi:hypothetical protein